MSRKRRILPDWVAQSSNKNKKVKRNLKNTNKKATQTHQQTQSQSQNDDSHQHPNKRHKPSTPPPESRPDSIIGDSNKEQQLTDTTMVVDKADVKATKAHVQKPKNTQKPKKTITTKKTTKAKKKGKDLDEDDSEGSVGSLKDFVIDDYGHSNSNSNSSGSSSYSSDHMQDDEEYDVQEDIQALRHDRGARKTLRRARDAVGDDLLLSEDDDDDDDDDDEYDEFDDLDTTLGGSFSMMLNEPPAKKRKGKRTVCDILPLCRFGKSCYRKHRKHFSEFAHPWIDQSIHKQ
mmetsp:Transcript_50/g.77  ORF Transcript_50/g.77 Transcript_50/m.77 type:complete len:289 (-) Transcript_50:4-870(-)